MAKNNLGRNKKKVIIVTLSFALSIVLLNSVYTYVTSFDFDKFVWRIAATTACRMSVMANTYISKEDEEWILENIRYCDNPFTCPHGRPTIIKYPKYELEKLFKRVN